MTARPLSAMFRSPLVRAVAACLLLAMLGACGGNKYRIHVEGKAEPVDYGKRYVILAGIMETRADSPQFQAVASMLERVLTARGYTKAEGVEQADLGIYVEFGVKEVTGPFPGGPGGYGPSLGPVSFHTFGSAQASPASQQSLESGINGGFAQASGQASGQFPTAGFGAGAGPYRPFAGPGFMERTFSRWINVEAVDFARYKANDPKNVVWSVRVSSRGDSSSMEKALPFFATALDKAVGHKVSAAYEVDSNGNLTEMQPPKPQHGGRFKP